MHQKMLFFIQIMFIVKIVMFKEIPLRKCIVPLYTNIKTGTYRPGGTLEEANSVDSYPEIISEEGLGSWPALSSIPVFLRLFGISL